MSFGWTRRQTVIALVCLAYSYIYLICVRYFQVDHLAVYNSIGALVRRYHWFPSSCVPAPVTMGSIDSKSHLRKLQHFKTDYSPIEITQYESSRTGMRVVTVDQKGPKVYGFFALATEIHDDSGAPHTLEHLCFMGSRTYKYKGFLDKLATRSYSNTNAWTATDHTAYTLETAGWAGFRQILPVYLEHVILPTLTDAGCTTEVHHIDGAGNDAGVVYSEMQGIQNTPNELTDLKAKRTLYPDGVGFRYETGGMLEHLRVLTAERIREFHREMYQPKNLCLVLTGEINHDELLVTLDEFEASIIDQIPSPETPFHRPWIESKQTPALAQTTIETIEFPEEDESYGQIDIRFLGPDIADALDSGALEVVLLYLAGSSAAILDNTLVEKEQLASGVYYNSEPRPKSEITFSLSGVETQQLKRVEERFFEVLKEAVKKDLDMSFMKDCLERFVRTTKFAAESSLVAFAEPIIADYLFGKRDGSTLEAMKTLDIFTKTLASWTESQWKDFMVKYLTDAHHVSILGVPSAKLSEKLKKDEADRLEQQKKELGPDGLKRKAEELERAKAENDREIPNELLAEFEVPSTDSIHFITTAAARLGPALKIGRPDNRYQEIIERDGKETPLFIDFEQIESNFVRVNLILSTELIPLELRPLLAVYLEAFFNLPVERDGQTIDFEQVVVELERDTVGYSIELADVLGSLECLRINLQVEVEKYEVAIRWLKELLWSSIFDVERLQAVNSRLLADVPDAKRSGDGMVGACHFMVHLAPESVGRAKSTLVKALYLKRIRQMLKNEPDRVVAMLQGLRQHLCLFENMRVVVIGDVEKLKNPVSSWQPFLHGLDVDKPLTPLSRRLDKLSEAGKHPGKHSYIIPIPAIDSSFANAITRGPTAYDDPRLPALMVAMSFMNSVEGPLWVAVRGTGLAYGTSLSYDIEAGYLYLDVYRSPDASKAFEASRKVIEGYMNGETVFNPLMLEGAVSSIVVTFANEQQTMANAAASNFVRTVIRGLPENHMHNMLEKVRAITVPEIRQSLKDLVYPIFEKDKSDVIVTCAPGLKDTIKSSLETAGFAAEIRDLSWFQDDYGLKGDGGDEDDDNDGDDDDDDDDDDDESYEIVDDENSYKDDMKP